MAIRIVPPEPQDYFDCKGQLFAVVWTVCWLISNAGAQDVFHYRVPDGSTAGNFAWGTTGLDASSGRSESPHEALDPWYPIPSEWHSGDFHYERSVGLGDPLTGTSWRNRPLHAGWLFGGLVGDDLMSGRAEQTGDIVGGYRLGWDFDHYWGSEARFAFANVNFTDTEDSTTSRSARHQYGDLNLLYYPWGDSRWRPFGSIGLGWGFFEYSLADGQAIDKTLLNVPLAVGAKYYFQNWMALRVTATDNWSIGHGALDTMHNVMLTADVEMRFGGRRTSYFPYNGSIHLW